MPAQTQDKPLLSVVKKGTDKQASILVVNNDDAVSTELKRAFASVSTASLTLATDPETAIRMLASGPYDLVAVDPAVSPGGFELLKHVKDRYRWIATLVATGNQEPQFLRQAVKCRIDGLLFRPTTSAEFVDQALLLAEAVSTRRRKQQNRVLAIGAHPDDVEIGCGGTLAKHHARGDVLHVLTLTRGAAGGDVNQRTVEAHRAAELLGATLEITNLPDTRVGSGIETIDIIQAAIRELQPTHVYTHCDEDTHQDHRAVHAASLVAARSVPNVYCYQAPSSTVEFRPHRFVDITDFIKLKIQAIDTYKSQVERMDALQHDVILSTARYWGRFAGYVLAEPMRIVRQRDSDMVPESARQAAAPQSMSTVAD
ncbi:PIG-L family deacetylase [Reyranella sp.]|uniref:PIG-L family deacetylase n=1 Tax=Reyranella sp. TaxID=1929291 RepID=UPI003D0BC774